jgi:hypothetical protein
VGGGVAVGGTVVAGGALGVVGASVAGVAVLVRIVMLGSAEADALALGDADPDDAGASPSGRPRKTRPITKTVSSPPATAASARSIQRGPRRGGGITRVVSFEGGVPVMRASSGTRRAARRRSAR